MKERLQAVDPRLLWKDYEEDQKMIDIISLVKERKITYLKSDNLYLEGFLDLSEEEAIDILLQLGDYGLTVPLDLLVSGELPIKEHPRLVADIVLLKIINMDAKIREERYRRWEEHYQIAEYPVKLKKPEEYEIASWLPGDFIKETFLTPEEYESLTKEK